MTKILIIEDEEILRNEVGDWLSFEGYDVISAEDGVIGVELGTRELPDLIISDITMPRLDGYGVLLEMHANPATAHIPFILVTARASHDDIRQGMAMGADDYITKPFTHIEIMAAVQSRLEKKATIERNQQRQIDGLEQALAQEHEALLLKAKLVAMFSHDFRNPLAAILSSNSLLRNYSDRLDEARRFKHMDHIDAAVRQLLQMLDDMLMVAEMETGNFASEQTSLDIGQFLDGLITEFQLVAGDTHHLSFENNCKDMVVIDARLLRQIAANLISNAIKYSPQGGEVHISLGKQKDQCILSVQDHGIGIPEADQARLFNAFQRGKNVGGISGTGLGLAIVKQAVDLQGGSIDFESQVGIGTTIVVTLPCPTP